jgi:RNA polymerase sigma factor (sigma-70 family)
MESGIEILLQAAKKGDKKALEELVVKIQDRIYGLALRMLYSPADAEDALQEILLRIITNLHSYRGESSFTTWMYRVASNYLLTVRRRQAELTSVSFEEFECCCDSTIALNWQQSGSEVLQNLFVEEIRISCLQALLLCLDRGHRLVYLLADVFDINSEEGAVVLEITPSAFRKRLSRARKKIRDFLTRKCALINPDNPCKCERQVSSRLDSDRFEGKNIVFANHPCRVNHNKNALILIKEMDELNKITALFKLYPDFHSPTVGMHLVTPSLIRKYGGAEGEKP